MVPKFRFDAILGGEGNVTSQQWLLFVSFT